MGCRGYRRQAAEEALARLGPLSSLRRRGREARQDLSQRIDRAEEDIARAVERVGGLGDRVDRLAREGQVPMPSTPSTVGAVTG